MRRIFAFSLCLLLLAGALPAALAVPESVDYDVLVTPEDNIGLNMREGPSSVYARVRPGPCPAAGPGRRDCLSGRFWKPRYRPDHEHQED